jgi:hypothetical protein
LVSPEWKPLITLLEDVLGRLFADLSAQRPIGASIAAGHHRPGVDHGLVRLASVGEGAELVDAQIEQSTGPLINAVEADRPVTTPDLWQDSRWPGLTRQAVVGRFPHRGDTWSRLRGYAAVCSGWDGGGVLVVSCCLGQAADDTTLAHLHRYEGLAAAALAVVHAATADGPAHVLTMLRTRAVIEQAKGAIIAATHCDADSAWRTLCIVSQHLNVKLRDLAIALIEYLGRAPAEQPPGLPEYRRDESLALDMPALWALITESSE